MVLFNAALLAMFAVVYMQNDQRGSLLWLFWIFFLFSNGNAFLMNNSLLIALGYAILCAVFSFVALRLVWLSTLSIRCKRRCRSLNSKILPDGEGVSTTNDHCVKRFRDWWHRVMGVRGPYFDLRLLAEEIFELATQTIAALSASQSVSNVPLNIIYAIVIFLSSIASFFFRRIFRNSIVKQRIACLLADLVLDFVWGTLLPIWMYLPIVKIRLDLANVLEYVDSFSNSTREIERVLIISWKLYALSIIPFCNLLFNILEIQSSLREIKPTKTESHTQARPANATTTSPQRFTVGRVRAGICVRMAHAFLPMYGICVLILALTANGVFRAVPQSNQLGCMHRVYPWFSTKEACLGRQINCSALNIEGSQAKLEQALELFDRSSLADCSSLAAPSS